LYQQIKLHNILHFDFLCNNEWLNYFQGLGAMSKINLPNTFELLEKFEECRRIDDVMKVALACASTYGVEHILAGIMPEKNLTPQQQMEHILFGKLPEGWGARYFEKNYLEVDPTIAHVRNSNEVLRWKQMPTTSVNRQGRVVMNEAREFSLIDGITIPQLSLDGMRIGVSFSGRHMRDIPSTWTDLNVLSAMAVMRALGIYRETQKPEHSLLSARERECLLWVADGKSDWEISMILSISQKTVEKHLANCRQKLNVVNRSQAVARAIHNGIIR